MRAPVRYDTIACTNHSTSFRLPSSARQQTSSSLKNTHAAARCVSYCISTLWSSIRYLVYNIGLVFSQVSHFNKVSSVNKLGDRSFSAAGPRLWNDLPPGLRRPGLTFDSFKKSLKTHLFGDWRAWWLIWVYRRFINKFIYLSIYGTWR